jgi:hypothetical protein
MQSQSKQESILLRDAGTKHVRTSRNSSPYLSSDLEETWGLRDGGGRHVTFERPTSYLPSLSLPLPQPFPLPLALPLTLLHR